MEEHERYGLLGAATITRESRHNGGRAQRAARGKPTGPRREKFIERVGGRRRPGNDPRQLSKPVARATGRAGDAGPRLSRAVRHAIVPSTGTADLQVRYVSTGVPAAERRSRTSRCRKKTRASLQIRYDGRECRRSGRGHHAARDYAGATAREIKPNRATRRSRGGAILPIVAGIAGLEDEILVAGVRKGRREVTPATTPTTSPWASGTTCPR